MRSTRMLNKITNNNPPGEAYIERDHTLDEIDMLRCEHHIERLDVREQMLYFAPTDDGEYERCLLHHICDSHWISISFKSDDARGA